MNEQEIKDTYRLIMSDAHKNANRIRAEARREAEEGMKKVLHEAGVWVEQVHKDVNPVVRFVHRCVCFEGTPGRKVLDFLLGSARECYCCSALRGFVYGAVCTAFLFAVILCASH